MSPLQFERLREAQLAFADLAVVDTCAQYGDVVDWLRAARKAVEVVSRWLETSVRDALPRVRAGECDVDKLTSLLERVSRSAFAADRLDDVLREARQLIDALGKFSADIGRTPLLTTGTDIFTSTAWNYCTRGGNMPHERMLICVLSTAPCVDLKKHSGALFFDEPL